MTQKKKPVPETKETSVKAKTLLVKGADGEFKVTIPVGARITFGPTIPFQTKNKFGGESFNPGGGYSIRVYETAKNDSLVAVFANVLEFRDITMPHAKLVIRESGKSVWKSDEEGYSVETQVQKDKAWEKPLLGE